MAHEARDNSDGTLLVRPRTWWQVQMLDDEATARRHYQVWKVLAELAYAEAEYEASELRKAGHLARIVEA